MAHVTFDGPASPGSSARVLKQDVSEDLDHGVRDITVIVLATHVTTLSGQVITVANFVLFSTKMVFIHGICGRMGTIGVDTLAIPIDGDEVLRFEALWWQVGEKELLRAAHNSWSRPRFVWRFIGRLSRKGLTRHDMLLDARITVLADTLEARQ
jgi:hypothetical protein